MCKMDKTRSNNACVNGACACVILSYLHALQKIKALMCCFAYIMCIKEGYEKFVPKLDMQFHAIKKCFFTVYIN